MSTACSRPAHYNKKPDRDLGPKLEHTNLPPQLLLLTQILLPIMIINAIAINKYKTINSNK